MRVDELIQNTYVKYVFCFIVFLVILNIIDRIRYGKGTGNYRYDFVKAHPGKRRAGKQGYWYRCACCGKWCGRPGKEKARIYDCDKMEVDHIRPWYKGGSDKVWNLQAMCHDCNRSKSDKASFKDKVKILRNDLVHLDFVWAFFRRGARQNKVLKGLGITKRKGY